MQYLTLALLLLSSSCATTLSAYVPTATSPREGQEVAAWIVWHDAYLRNDPPPKVRWIDEAQTNCTTDKGRSGFGTPMGCRDGLTPTPFNVTCVWHADELGFSTTTMPHEYEHAKMARAGILDPDHTRPEWHQGGEVEKAVDLLRAVGL